MVNTSKKTWEQLSLNISIDELCNSYNNPSGFQKELIQYIEQKFNTLEDATSIEVGSSFGVTSALLPVKFKKTLLDYNENALNKAKEFFQAIKQPVDLLHMNIFDLDKLENKYDLVFNAGVLEHFNKKERQIIINNMCYITKPGGFIIIAVPNHQSIPYRLGYLYRKITNNWPFPPENKVNNLSNEISKIENLILVESIILDKNSIYYYLPNFLRRILIYADKWCNFEGYLKVFALKKEMKIL